MSPDPLMASAKIWDPQTWNRYTYGRNNPLKMIDPTGMAEVTAAQCAQDKGCVTVNVNVIYDKNSNYGKGLTDDQKAAAMALSSIVVHEMKRSRIAQILWISMVLASLILVLALLLWRNTSMRMRFRHWLEPLVAIGRRIRLPF